MLTVLNVVKVGVPQLVTSYLQCAVPIPIANHFMFAFQVIMNPHIVNLRPTQIFASLKLAVEAILALTVDVTVIKEHPVSSILIVGPGIALDNQSLDGMMVNGQPMLKYLRVLNLNV